VGDTGYGGVRHGASHPVFLLKGPNMAYTAVVLDEESQTKLANWFLIPEGHVV
jgi:hypothetical protein